MSICEPMGHRTMKILEEQGYTQGLSAVLLKKAKLLILLKTSVGYIAMGPGNKHSVNSL